MPQPVRPPAPPPEAPAMKPKGIVYYIDAHCRPGDTRPDLFEPDERVYHMPCVACIHRGASREHCKGCRHYAT